MDPLTILLLLVGFGLLIAGGEVLVNGASTLAAWFGISPVVIGLTVVAFGTSSPELAVAIGSSIAGEPDLVIGNVIGSNIYNVLLILGVAALVAPLIVGVQLVQRDVPLMVLASIGVGIMATDGVIDRLDGLILVGSLIAWISYTVRESRRGSRRGRPDPEAIDGATVVRTRPSVPRQLALIGSGLVMLVVGAQMLVDGAISVASAFGLPPLIIGLTVVALGTSLPELATSVIASIRGERDIAVGNVVGSNMFNLLAVLGLTALLVPDGIAVASGALTFDMPVMIGVAVACLPIFFTGHLIARWEGALFLAYGIGYTAFLILTATQHPVVDALGDAIVFLVPLTAVTLAVLAARQFRSHGLRTPRLPGRAPR